MKLLYLFFCFYNFLLSSTSCVVYPIQIPAIGGKNAAEKNVVYIKSTLVIRPPGYKATHCLVQTKLFAVKVYGYKAPTGIRPPFSWSLGVAL